MPLLTGAAAALIRERAGRREFAPAVARLRAEVRELAGQGLRAPQARAGYYHDYFCPVHAVELVFDPNLPFEHRCPVDGESFTGPAQTAAWRWFVNNRLYTLALKAGLLATATGEAGHAALARSVLLDYAARYSAYAPDAAYDFSGRMGFHGLDEAVCLVHLAWAFSMAWDDGRGDGAAEVRRQLLEPAAEWVARLRRNRIHNIECWLNAALVAAGTACGRPDLVESALDGKYGFRGQLERGVLGDGLWYELSLSYHFYTLMAFLWTALACESVRPELASPPQLERMLTAPLRMASAEGRLPAMNDCWYPIDLISRCGHGIPEPPAFYEAGWGRYGRDEFGRALARSYRQRPRDTAECLLWGRPDLPEVENGDRPGSVLMPDAGIAVLRSGFTQVSLKYGRHGGPHGHYDKLGIAIEAEGLTLSPDLGTPGYGVGLNERWYRHTLSHNTVMVDGMPQPPAWGALVDFNHDGEVQLADARAEWGMAPYRGVRMRRAVLLRPHYLLDVFLAEAEEQRDFDWIYHNRGRVVDPEAPGAKIAAAVPRLYADLGSVRPAGVATKFTWETGGAALSLFLPGRARGEKRFLAEGPFNSAAELAPVLLRRVAGRKALFVALFCPWTGRPSVDGVGFGGGRLGEKVRIAVQLGGVEERWSIGPCASTAGKWDYGFEARELGRHDRDDMI